MCTYMDHLCSGLWFVCSCAEIDYKSHSTYKWFNQKTKEFHHQMHSTVSDSWQSLAQKKQWIDWYVCMRVCMYVCVLCTCAVYVRVTGKKCFCITYRLWFRFTGYSGLLTSCRMEVVDTVAKCNEHLTKEEDARPRAVLSQKLLALLFYANLPLQRR